MRPVPNGEGTEYGGDPDKQEHEVVYVIRAVMKAKGRD